MGRAAGASVYIPDFDKANCARQFLFLPVRKRRKLRRVRIKGAHRDVPENGLIDRALKLCEIRRAERDTEIHLHFALAQVKAHIFRAEEAMRKPRQHVLTRVLLHKVKAALPVDRPCDCAADR